MSESVDIVWLRDDFRLDDQPAIHAAANSPRSSFIFTMSPAAGRVRLAAQRNGGLPSR